MLQKLNDPAVHEVVGRTLINTLKLGLVAAIFIATQQAFQKSSNDLITVASQDVAKLAE